MGSAEAKTMAAVRREADIHLHAGEQREWDNRAPAAVAAAGLHASRIDVAALVYDREDSLRRTC